MVPSHSAWHCEVHPLALVAYTPALKPAPALVHPGKMRDVLGQSITIQFEIVDKRPWCVCAPPRPALRDVT